jgi:hypothetical protein
MSKWPKHETDQQSLASTPFKNFWNAYLVQAKLCIFVSSDLFNVFYNIEQIRMKYRTEYIWKIYKPECIIYIFVCFNN